MEEIVVKISKEMATTLGGHSLFGLISKDLRTNPDCNKVKFLFEETSMTWKREHGGPDEVILPEYVLTCVCKDIADMIQEHGLRITIDTYSE